MNRSLLGNLLILTFLVLAATGIVMYFVPFEKNIVAIHTWFALIFVLGIFMHIFNNKRPLKNYAIGKKGKLLTRLQSPFLMVLLSTLCIGAYMDNSWVHGLYEWGNALRNSKLGKQENTWKYQTIDLSGALPGTSTITVEVKKGESFQYPLFAIWMEDSIGKYVETLYVSRVIASGVYDYGIKTNGIWKPSSKRRPEALPYWSHKRNIRAADGYYVPLGASPDLDGVSGATPTDNFMVDLSGKQAYSGAFRIYLEVNQSYDWNSFYSKDRYPQDEIYSGSGQVGQPALIYRTSLLDSNIPGYHLMELVGHGHPSGRNGKLFEDLSAITTARHIVDRVIVKIK